MPVLLVVAYVPYKSGGPEVATQAATRLTKLPALPKLGETYGYVFSQVEEILHSPNSAASLSNLELQSTSSARYSTTVQESTSTVLVTPKGGSYFPSFVSESSISDHFVQHGFEEVITEVSLYSSEADSKIIQCALVTFTSAKHATDAISLLNGTLFSGKEKLILTLQMVPADSEFLKVGEPQVKLKPQEVCLSDGGYVSSSLGSATSLSTPELKGLGCPIYQRSGTSSPLVPQTQGTCAVFVGTKSRKPFPSCINASHLREHFVSYRDHIQDVQIVCNRSRNDNKSFGLIAFSSRHTAMRAIEEFDGSSLLGMCALHLDFYQQKGSIQQVPSRLQSKPDPYPKLHKSLDEGSISDQSCKGTKCSKLLGRCEVKLNVHEQRDRSQQEDGVSTCMNVQLPHKPVLSELEFESELEDFVSFDQPQIVHVGTISCEPLPDYITSTQLKEHFMKYSEYVLDAQIAFDPETKRSCGYGYVTFKSRQAAKEAIQCHNGIEVFEGYQLHLTFTSVLGESDINSSEPVAQGICVVWLSTESSACIPGYVHSGHVEDHFSEFKEHLVNVRITDQRKTRFGFVTFLSATAAQAAIQSLDGSILLGDIKLRLDCDCDYGGSGPLQGSETISCLSSHTSSKPFDVIFPEAFTSSTGAIGDIPTAPELELSKIALDTENDQPAICISNLNPLVAGTDIEALFSEYNLTVSRCDLHGSTDSESKTAIVYLAAPAQVDFAVKKLNNQSFLGSRVVAFPVITAPGCAIIDQIPVAVHKKEMTEQLYLFIKARSHEDINVFERRGGIFSHKGSRADIYAPTQAVLDHFIHSTVNTCEELLLKLDTRQWSMLVSVGEQEKTQFGDLLLPLSNNTDIRILLLHEQLAILFVGTREAVSSACKHFSVALDSEMVVERLKLDALVHLYRGLDSLVLETYGIRLQGFYPGSSALKFSGPLRSVGSAKDIVCRVLFQFCAKRISFPYPSILVLSAQKRLSEENIDAFLHYLHEQSSIDPHVGELHVCCFKEVHLIHALAVLQSKPYERCIPLTSGSVEMTDQCRRLEDEFTLLIQLPDHSNPNAIVLGYVDRDVEEVVSKLINYSSVEVFPLQTTALQCDPMQMSYLKQVFFISPTHKASVLRNSLPVQVLCPEKDILLTGTQHDISAAQYQIESQLLQGLICYAYKFESSWDFCSHIEQYVLKPMINLMNLDITYSCEKGGDTVSIYSHTAVDFKEALKLLQDVKPQSESFDVPPETATCVTQKELKSMEQNYRTTVRFHDQPVHTVVIRGLSQNEISACWKELNSLIDALCVIKEIELSVLHAKYLSRMRSRDLKELRNECEVTIPLLPFTDYPDEQKLITVKVRGPVKPATLATKNIRLWCSGLHLDTCQVHCLPKYLEIWKKRWEDFISNQESKHHLSIEFKPDISSLTTSTVVKFFICGTDRTAIATVIQLIQREENGEKVAMEHLKLTKQQFPVVVRALKDKQLLLQGKYGIVIEEDEIMSEITLKTPLAAKADLVIAAKAVSEFAAIHTQSTKRLICEVASIGLVLVSKSFGYLAELERIAEQNHVILQPLRGPTPGVQLTGAIRAIQAVEEKFLSALDSISRVMGHDEVQVASSYLPHFSTYEFFQLESSLREELCVLCFYPDGSRQTEVKQEVSLKCTNQVTVQICKGSILLAQSDTIVNAANEDLQHRGGLAKEILDAGGPSIQTESTRYIRDHGKLQPGDAICLESGNLPCRKLIHAVGPQWNGGNNGEDNDLYQAVLNSLACAESAQLSSIAFPAIGTGVFSIPLRFCAQWSLTAVNHYFTQLCPQSQVHMVRFVLFTEEAASVFSKVLDSGIIKVSSTSSPTLPRMVQGHSPQHYPEPPSPSLQLAQAGTSGAPSTQASHSSATYQWYWQDDYGSFSPYSQRDSHCLTNQFLLSRTGVLRLHIAKSQYEINFQTMTQTNLSTMFQRRVTYEQLGEGASAKTQTGQNKIQWFYEARPGIFSPYTARDSAVIENMYQGGPSTLLYISGKNYQFDIRNMQQINNATKSRRAIRREALNFQVTTTTRVDIEAIAEAQVEEEEEEEEEEDEAASRAPVVTISLKGPKQNLPKAKSKLQDKFSSMIKHHYIPLPLGFTPAQNCKLRSLAKRHCTSCKITKEKTEGGTTSVGSRLKLRGLEQGVHRAEADVLKEIIAIQSSLVAIPHKTEISYPPNWEPQSHPVVELFHVRDGTPEYVKVASKFSETLPNVRIVQIQRIQNKWLWGKYDQHKQRMKEKNAGRINEKELFHGTKRTPPNEIYDSEEGFDMRFSSIGMWGQATYFAANASYSDRYAYWARNGCNKEVFFARVLTGDTFNCPPDKSLRMPPIKPAGSAVQLGQVRYDTVSGTTSGSEVYMTYSNDKAYPAYLIQYTDIAGPGALLPRPLVFAHYHQYPHYRGF